MSSENEKKKEKEKEAEPETLRRGLPRRDTRTRQSRADDEKPKTGQEKSKSAVSIFFDFFSAFLSLSKAFVVFARGV